MKISKLSKENQFSMEQRTVPYVPYWPWGN